MSEAELPDSFDVPDDISGLTGGAAASGAAAPSVALIITQIAAAEPLAAACALAKVPVDAFVTEIGAIASCRDLSDGGPQRAARAISDLVKDIPIVLIERREGQLTASRWQLGKQEAELPAGLVLDGAPEVMEDLLTQASTISDVENVITSVGISRFKAMRQLASIARRAKKS